MIAPLRRPSNSLTAKLLARVEGGATEMSVVVPTDLRHILSVTAARSIQNQFTNPANLGIRLRLMGLIAFDMHFSISGMTTVGPLR